MCILSLLDPNKFSNHLKVAINNRIINEGNNRNAREQALFLGKFVFDNVLGGFAIIDDALGNLILH